MAAVVNDKVQGAGAGDGDRRVEMLPAAWQVPPHAIMLEHVRGGCQWGGMAAGVGSRPPGGHIEKECVLSVFPPADVPEVRASEWSSGGVQPAIRLTGRGQEGKQLRPWEAAVGRCRDGRVVPCILWWKCSGRRGFSGVHSYSMWGELVS